MHKFTTMDQALTQIKSLDKPLAIYYFGTNSESNPNLLRLKNETSSGAFVVNDMIVQYLSPYAAFGGVGASGYGRIHGYEGFK